MNVNQEADGSLTRFQVQDGFPQQFSMSWYNTGSVGCPTQARVQLFNASSGNHSYTAWTRETSLWPGDTADWTATAALPAGTYRYRVDVFHCTQTTAVKQGNLSSTGHTSEHQAITVPGTTATRDRITMYLRSNTSTAQVHAIPVDHPAGWRIPAATTQLANDITKTRLSYYPSIWKPATITYRFVTADGRILGTETLSVTETQPFTTQVRLLYLELVTRTRSLF